jgi:PHD/YefM family antitoxin component YafN of YafNO toxin-antitoxin module
MEAIHPQYITDKDGKKVSVVIPLAEYEQMLDELEELYDIRLYDEAKNDKEPSMPFDEYVKKRRAK